MLGLYQKHTLDKKVHELNFPCGGWFQININMCGGGQSCKQIHCQYCMNPGKYYGSCFAKLITEEKDLK